MSASRPSIARLRFSRGASPVASAASRGAAHGACSSGTELIELPREEGLDLLDWLGLGRPEFGAIAARELAPRCRRRLWNIERNAHPSRRARTLELLAFAEAAGEGMVLFG